MPIAFELQQVLSFVFLNCFQIELCCLNSLKELVIVNWSHVIANWSLKCIKEMALKVLSCSSCSPNDKKRDKSKTFLCSKLENIYENLNFLHLQ